MLCKLKHHRAKRNLYNIQFKPSQIAKVSKSNKQRKKKLTIN